MIARRCRVHAARTYRAFAAIAFVAVGVTPCPARATFSVAAVDVATGASGAAAASCIAPAEVSIVYGPVPDHGLVVVQSFLHQGTLARGISGLAAGEDPATVMQHLLDPAFDPDAAMRQIAILDLEGHVAIHTGARALAFASHRVHAVGDFVFSVQGNRLTGAPVLDRMARAFAEGSDNGPGCDLAARLRDALLAAPAPGEGDALCVDGGVPADSAFLGVALPGGGTLALDATDVGIDPMPRIAESFDAFRRATPCPDPARPPDAPPADGPDDGADPTVQPGGSGCGIAPANGPGVVNGLGLGAILLGAAARLRKRLRARPGTRA